MLEHGGGNGSSTAPGALDPLSKIMECDGIVLTRWHTVCSPDAVGSNSKFQFDIPLFLSTVAYIFPLCILHLLGLIHFTHSRPESRTLGRVTRWLLLSSSTRAPGSTSRLSLGLTFASPSAWNWLTTGTLTIYNSADHRGPG